jgi:hypothetical protein
MASRYKHVVEGDERVILHAANSLDNYNIDNPEKKIYFRYENRGAWSRAIFQRKKDVKLFDDFLVIWKIYFRNLDKEFLDSLFISS